MQYSKTIFGAAELPEMESLSPKNKNVNYFLYVTNAFIKYAWVKYLKDKIGETDLNDFIEIVNELLEWLCKNG